MENNIGRQIRTHRLHCSMTQEKLAELLCVTPQAVSKWENGVSYPDITLLPELSAALGIKIDELFETSLDTHLRRIEQMMENDVALSREDFDYAEGLLKEQGRRQCWPQQVPCVSPNSLVYSPYLSARFSLFPYYLLVPGFERPDTDPGYLLKSTFNFA